MKNRTKMITTALVLLVSASTSFAQTSASATVTATIVTPIQITKDVDMDFGNVAVQTLTGGTVTLSPSGVRTPTGGVTLPATAGTVTAASFTVEGQAGYTYAITLPSSPITITSAGNTMSVGMFTSSPDETGVLTAGTETLNVGATLQVSAGQPAGVYVSADPFDVTVNYN